MLQHQEPRAYPRLRSSNGHSDTEPTKVPNLNEPYLNSTKKRVRRGRIAGLIEEFDRLGRGYSCPVKRAREDRRILRNGVANLGHSSATTTIAYSQRQAVDDRGDQRAHPRTPATVLLRRKRMEKDGKARKRTRGEAKGGVLRTTRQQKSERTVAENKRASVEY